MVQREETDWGVKLTLEMLGKSKEVKLTCEVEDHRDDNPPETRFWLDSTPSKKPLRMIDMVVIQQGLHQFLEMVKDEVAKMMNPKRRKKRRPGS